jgi:hypothetical protein
LNMHRARALSCRARNTRRSISSRFRSNITYNNCFKHPLRAAAGENHEAAVLAACCSPAAFAPSFSFNTFVRFECLRVLQNSTHAPLEPLCPENRPP